MKRTITRILALALSLACLFSFAPMRPAHADGAFPENVTIQSERNLSATTPLTTSSITAAVAGRI